MIAGKELDILITKKVMGFKKARGVCRCYSTNIAAAWTVVKYLGSLGPANEFKLGQDYEGLWHCTFKGTRDSGPFMGEEYNGDTAPHAICLAALKVFVK